MGTVTVHVGSMPTPPGNPDHTCTLEGNHIRLAEAATSPDLPQPHDVCSGLSRSCRSPLRGRARRLLSMARDQPHDGPYIPPDWEPTILWIGPSGLAARRCRSSS